MAPGIVSLLLSLVFWAGLPAMALLLVAGALDAGHIGVTLWRSWLNKEEVRSAIVFYLLMPLAIFSVTLILQTWSPRLLLVLMTYAVLWHQMRQYYGIYRWYEFLNGRSSGLSRWLLGLLMVLPVLLAHTSPSGISGVFSPNSLLKVHEHWLPAPLAVLYGVTLLLWAFSELVFWIRGFRELNRVVAMATPALLFGIIFCVQSSWISQLSALVIAHACQYFAVTWIGVLRTQPKRFSANGPGLLLFSIPAILFIMLLSILAEPDKFMTVSTQVESVFFALLTTFSLCHYAVDGRIWRHRHRESEALYRR